MYNDDKGMIGTVIGSWIVAAAVGALATVLLWVLGDWSFLQGAFVGFIVVVVVGLVISLIMMRPLPAPGEVSANVIKPTVAPTTAKATAVSEPVAKTKEPAPVKADPPKPAAKKAAPKKAEPKQAAPKEVSADGRPAGLTEAARAGGADDLKRIGGVGPKLEETLNGLGIWHFDQVAGLKKKDIAWVDERLRFKGRIERDDWIGQAKTLAQGGETEFSKKKRKS